MSSYSKKIKQQLRELAMQAYERELQRELTMLDRSFGEWRNGAISSGELSHRVHPHKLHSIDVIPSA